MLCELERTTALGLFNVAESYWRAAMHIHSSALLKGMHNSPVSFLFYHAIELYLKAFLRHHGHTPRTAEQEVRAQDLLSFVADSGTISC
jgi:hypothetical protein